MEAIECFCVNFSGSLDVKGYFQTFTLLNLGDMPYDVQSAFSFIGGHLDIVALSVCTLHRPVLDFKLSWKHIVDVQVAQGCVAVVFKEDQDLIAAFSSKRNRLLTGTEVTTVVDDLDGWCFRWFAGTDRAETLRAEFNPCRTVHTCIVRCWVRSIEGVRNFNLLSGL